MRFVLGMITGVIVGVTATTIASGQSGQDLRVEFERIRSDLEKRDFDAIGAHLEERFKELQASLEERFAQAEEIAADAADDAADAVTEAEEALEEDAEGPATA